MKGSSITLFFYKKSLFFTFFIRIFGKNNRKSVKECFSLGSYALVFMPKEGTIGNKLKCMKYLNIQKVLLVIAALFAFTCEGYAQYLRTSYFMEGSHYRQQLNPALSPGRGYLNLPVIGTLNASVNSSTLGYQDVMDIIDNSEDSKFFMSNDFINKLDNVNNLNVNLSTDILSAGWYKGKNFWSFNIGIRNDIGASIPRSMFEFLRNMDGLDVDDWGRLSKINEKVGAQSLEINSYAEVGVGLARNINSRLTVGGRVKALLGIGNLKLNINDITVSSNVTGYEGVDWDNLTPEQVRNLRGNAEIRVDATLENSSKLIELAENDGVIDEIDFGSFGLAGYGLGIDLGASYKLLDKLTVSASILDLGFMKWSKKNTSVAKASAHQQYNLTNTSEAYDFVEKVSSGEVLNFDMLDMKLEQQAEKDRSTSLTSTLVIGAEYELLGDWLAVGALYTGRFVKPETLNELTFSANFRPKNYLNMALSYSVLQGAGKTFGLAAKLGPLFIGTDYMFFGKDTKNLNAYVGFSIPLNKQKKLKE